MGAVAAPDPCALALTATRFSHQVFVKGEFIGGADILLNMHESGELEKTLGPIRKEQKAQ